jgi:hypothetical protein
VVQSDRYLQLMSEVVMVFNEGQRSIRQPANAISPIGGAE